MSTEKQTKIERPRVNEIPQEGDSNTKLRKFVQLYFQEDGQEIPYLRFGRFFGDEHSEILGKALSEFGLPVLKNSKGKPVVSGENYRVAGMGLATRYENEVIIKVCIDSFIYKLHPDVNHLQQIKPFFPKGIELVVI